MSLAPDLKTQRLCGTRLPSLFSITLLLGIVVCQVAFAAPAYFNKPYLTWQSDPSTTMTINYQTAEAPERVEAVYDTSADAAEFQYRAEGVSRQIPGLPDGRYINSVELTGLTPGQVYHFRIPTTEGLSQTYAFRTVPDSDEPIRFATGGDTLGTHIFRQLLEQLTTQNPLFLVIGGDLAYADGDFEKIDRWEAWWDIWHDNDTTAEGKLIPLVLGIGNHETNKLVDTKEKRAPFYFGFFPQGGEAVFSHQFGANLGMIILDSGHLRAHHTQIDFLEEQLKAYAALPYRVAVYHVPLYPSHRDYEGSASAAARTHWLPLFDKYELSVGFENHDHTFKRTKRLRNNEVHPEGTIYVGDGNAGVMPRTVNEDLWYIDRIGRESHFWIVDVSPESMRLFAIDREGTIFDETTVEPNVLADN